MKIIQSLLDLILLVSKRLHRFWGSRISRALFFLCIRCRRFLICQPCEYLRFLPFQYLKNTCFARTDLRQTASFRCRCLLNHRVTDDDMLRRQAKRLFAVTNNILADLPLYLLCDSRLRKITTAYSNVYMLPVLRDSSHLAWKKLKSAHRYLVANLTQFYKRCPTHWNKTLKIFNPKNRYIYGRLRIPTLDTMLYNQSIRFSARYAKFTTSI